MENTNTNNALDILAELQNIGNVEFGENAQENVQGETTEYNEGSSSAVSEEAISDPLGMMIQEAEVKTVKVSKTLRSETISRLKFLVHYIAVSMTVFVILLVATNWTAYWSVLSNMIYPDQAKASGAELLSSLDRSKLNVFANEPKQKIETNKQTAQEIKAQLDAEGVNVNEDAYSMKRLLSTESNTNVAFNIAPYENRLIIPKIGKNVPLVDVVSTNVFDFDHMENIFMQELEKGVVRYPGSALPGEQGNSFIFGHSSNYPWIKGDYNSVFALLDNLEFGDEIIVYYKQRKYVYVIKEKKIVKPGDVKALDRDPSKKELSLMTCWPIGTTLKRMLVFAELQPSQP